jgi:HSP20 family molecular chaperone IbpA
VIREPRARGRAGGYGGGVTPTTDDRVAAQPSRDDVAAATLEAERLMAPQPVPVNVYETTGAVVVVAPVPAVCAEDVTIEVHPGAPGEAARLRFWAHLRSAAPRTYLLHEWDYGGYEREVDLPAGYGASVEASLANGQLAVRVLRGAPRHAVTTKPIAG